MAYSNVNIKILSLIANSIFEIHVFQNVISDLNLDTIGVSETRVDHKFKFKAPEYSIHRTHRNNTRGGVVSQR